MTWSKHRLSHKIQEWYTKKPYVIIFSALGGLCFVVPFLYGLGLALLYISYVLVLRRVLALSTLTGIFLAVLLFFSVNSLLSFALWGVHIPFLGVAAGALNMLFLLMFPVTRQVELGLPKFSGLFITLVFLATFGALTVPYLHDRSPATITKLVTQGEDNISHIELTKNVLRHNGIFFSNNPDQETHVIKNLAGYPQAVHANLALVVRAFENLHLAKTAYRFLVIYYFLASAIFALLISSIAFTGLYVAGLLGSKRLSVAGTAVMATALISLSATIFLGLFSAGFLTFIITPCLLLLTVVFLFAASRQAELPRRQLLILIASLFCAATQFSWLFLLPFVVPSFLIALVLIELGPEIRKFRVHQYYQVVRSHILSVIIVLFSCLQLPVQQITTAVKVGVNDPGYIYRVPISYSLLLLSVAGIVALLIWPRIKKWFRVYGIFIVLNILFSLAIYLYQMVTINDLSYYFFKSEYSILFLVWPLIISGLLILVGEGERRSKMVGKYGALGFTLLVLIACGLVFKKIVRPNIDTFWPYRWSLADSAADEVVINGYRKPSPVNYVVLGECLTADDYKLSRLSSVLSESTTSQIRSINLSILTDQNGSKQSIYNQLDGLPSSEKGKIDIIDIGNTLPDKGELHQTNLPSIDYPSVCKPIL